MDIPALWHTTLERLASTPVDAVAKTWLQESRLSHTPHVEVDDIDAPLTTSAPALHFMLEVPSDQARDMIHSRWRRSLETILTARGIVGRATKETKTETQKTQKEEKQ